MGDEINVDDHVPVERMVANVEAANLCQLTNVDIVTSYNEPTKEFHGYYGLPYQDHNYVAQPPPTPPASPVRMTINHRKKNPDLTKQTRPRTKVSRVGTRIGARIGELVGERRRTLKSVDKKESHVISPTIEVKNNGVDTCAESLDGSGSEAERDEPENKTTGIISDYSDSITRCICDFTHDDGYMICCDQCQVWQHIDCMGINRENIPEEYSCEKCLPRKVSRVRAKLIQKHKREEIFKLNNAEPDNMASSKHSKLQKSKTTQPVTNTNNNSKKLVNKNPETQERQRRNSQSAHKRRNKGSTDSSYLSVDEDSWPPTPSYENANSTTYSEGLREALSDLAASLHPQHLNEGKTILENYNKSLCKLNLLSNGKRGLETSCSVNTGQTIIEYHSHSILLEEFQQQHNIYQQANPFVLFYHLGEIALCADASNYGNEARFLRRSCTPNCQVEHVLNLNGELRLFLIAGKDMKKQTDLTIPFDFDFKQCEYLVECSCNRAQCPVKKHGKKFLPKPPPVKEVIPAATTMTRRSSAPPKIKQETPAQPLTIDTALPEIDENPIPRRKSANNSNLSSPIAENPTSNTPAATPTTATTTTTNTATAEKKQLTREERKMEAVLKMIEKMEKREEKKREYLQHQHKKPEQKPEPKPEPVESDDISQSSPVETPKPKPLSHRRKRNRSGVTPTARKRTASMASQPSVSELDEDSNQEPPAAAVSEVPSPSEVGSTSVGTITPAASFSTSYNGPRYPKTKKILSDWYNENGGTVKSSFTTPLTINTSTNNSQLQDFVMTNASPTATWQTLRRDSVNSRSDSYTPGLSKSLDSTKGSAKKRWLLMAMEEGDTDTTPTPIGSGPSSPHSINPQPLSTPVTNSITPLLNSPAPSLINPAMNGITSADTPISPNSNSHDFVTPLKKRRLARESVSVENTSSLPTSPEYETQPVETRATTTTQFIPPQDETANMAPISSEQKITTPTAANTTQEQTEEPSSEIASANISEVTPDVIEVEPEVIEVEPKPPKKIQTLPSSNIPLTVTQMSDSSTSSPELSSPVSSMLSPPEPRTLKDMMKQALPTDIDMIQPASTLSSNIQDIVSKALPTDSLQEMHRVLMASQTITFESPTRQSLAAFNQIDTKSKTLTTNSTSLESENTVTPVQVTESKQPVADKLSEQTVADKPSVQTVADKPSVQTVADKPSEQTVADKPSEQTAADKPSVQVVADEPNEQTPPEPEETVNSNSSPPTKKKVSLLEYRKRRLTSTQSTPEKNPSDFSTNMSVELLSPNQLKVQPISLPALPLFEDESVDAEPGTPKFLSLDERLRLEFGLEGKPREPQSSNPTEKTLPDCQPDLKINKERETTPPPPPPPPELSSLVQTCAVLENNKPVLNGIKSYTQDSNGFKVGARPQNWSAGYPNCPNSHSFESPQASIQHNSPLHNGSNTLYGKSPVKPTNHNHNRW